MHVGEDMVREPVGDSPVSAGGQAQVKVEPGGGNDPDDDDDDDAGDDDAGHADDNGGGEARVIVESVNGEWKNIEKQETNLLKPAVWSLKWNQL